MMHEDVITFKEWQHTDGHVDVMLVPGEIRFASACSPEWHLFCEGRQGSNSSAEHASSAREFTKWGKSVTTSTIVCATAANMALDDRQGFNGAVDAVHQKRWSSGGDGALICSKAEKVVALLSAGGLGTARTLGLDGWCPSASLLSVCEMQQQEKRARTKIPPDSRATDDASSTNIADDASSTNIAPNTDSAEGINIDWLAIRASFRFEPGLLQKTMALLSRAGAAAGTAAIGPSQYLAVHWRHADIAVEHPELYKHVGPPSAAALVRYLQVSAQQRRTSLVQLHCIDYPMYSSGLQWRNHRSSSACR
jgi:hypothetical protein